MKKTRSILASLLLAFAIFSQLVMPVNAATPTYDITGVWKVGNGDTFQMFQEKDEVNGIYVNSGFVHRWNGRYISPTKIKVIQIRRDRASNCEATMEIVITVNSVNSITAVSTSLESACSLTAGPSTIGTYTRLL